MRAQPNRKSSKASKKARATKKAIGKRAVPRFSERRMQLFKDIEEVVGLKLSDDQRRQIDIFIRIEQHGTVHDRVKSR